MRDGPFSAPTRQPASSLLAGGRRIKVSIYDLVVGDVVILSLGDQIPADGLMLSGQGLVSDEARFSLDRLPIGSRQAVGRLSTSCP